MEPNGDPENWLSWIYDEETIAPGDRIEVTGTVDLAPDPTASVASDRQPRLTRILRGTAEDSIRIRGRGGR